MSGQNREKAATLDCQIEKKAPHLLFSRLINREKLSTYGLSNKYREKDATYEVKNEEKLSTLKIL